MSLSIRNDNELKIWQSDVSLNEIKSIYGKDLSDGEFKTFVNIGRATNLNPFLREIWAVKYGSESANIFIGRDGYRKSAQKYHDYEYHHVDAVYSNDDFQYHVSTGEVNHKYDVRERGNLIGAFCIVKKKSSSRPFYVYVERKEYDSRKSVWASKPATMIKKVAEAQALRMAFQELFSGTYDESEDWKRPAERASTERVSNENVIEVTASTHVLDELLLEISQCDSLNVLQDIFIRGYKQLKVAKDENGLAQFIKAKDDKKRDLMAELDRLAEEQSI